VVSGRVVAGWGAGSLVVVGAAAAALINELHGGWRWWVAAATVVVVWAVGSGWLAYRSAQFGGGSQHAGSVLADRIDGSVMTQTSVEDGSAFSPHGVSGGDVVGEGAVRARMIGGDVSTRTDLRQPRTASRTPPADSGPPVAR
jgi:hypothetical protein